MPNEPFLRAFNLLCAHYPQARPLVCQGLPYDQPVMLVGFNPATMMDIPFLAFWNSQHGFDHSAWQTCYQQARQDKQICLKPAP